MDAARKRERARTEESPCDRPLDGASLRRPAKHARASDAPVDDPLALFAQLVQPAPLPSVPPQQPPPDRELCCRADPVFVAPLFPPPHAHPPALQRACTADSAGHSLSCALPLGAPAAGGPAQDAARPVPASSVSSQLALMAAIDADPAPFASTSYPPPMHHDTGLSPSVGSLASYATGSTPALTPSSSAMSLSPSHDTLSTLPAALSPDMAAIYLGTGGSSSPADYFSDPEAVAAAAAGAHHGLGFQSLGAAFPLETGDASSSKGKEREVPYPQQQPPLDSPQVPDKRPTVKPEDKMRRGEDLGLTLGDFDMLDTLGTGTFGRVILARLRTSPSRPQQQQPLYFAMKVLEKNTVVRLRQVEHVNSERSTLAHVRHPFVVNLFCTFQDEQNLYMLLEYVQGGELFSHLRRAGRFSADVARFYIANIILVLEHLHEQDIIYRDLKPENLLIDSTGHIKVTDFGFAKYVPERTWTLCGTPEYLAPEIITATGHGAAADWWALGVLLFELLAGYPPFFADNPLEIYEKILQGKYGVPRVIDPLAKDLIRRLLTADLTKRLGNLKGGAEDVKNHPWFQGVDWDAVSRREIRAPIIPLTSVPGDISHYERYPATPIESLPGVLRAISTRKYGFSPEMGPDPYGYLFPLF
ncbi:cAMP-dependent protein kinase [Rhodotorula paludigena]|uniref:cAMP-dependent protein kinase n=1 Tax=Rhodotorula paludigena TaxID=86838 RepID=UPI00317408B4